MLTTLGNFLSGMETKAIDLRVDRNVFLGNFLSGMETPARRDETGRDGRPWKLP